MLGEASPEEPMMGKIHIHAVEQQITDKETRSFLAQVCTALGFGRLPWGAMRVVAKDVLDGKYEDDVQHYQNTYDVDLAAMAREALDK